MEVRVVKEIEGQKIKAIDFVAGVGLRLDISGGTNDTGVFFSKLKVQEKQRQFWITSQDDLKKFDSNFLDDGRINTAVISSRGDLDIKLSNGISLLCPHEIDVEAWEIRWLDGKQIISLPGGGWDEF